MVSFSIAKSLDLFHEFNLSFGSGDAIRVNTNSFSVQLQPTPEMLHLDHSHPS
jgi:hypothetical protein